MAESFRVLVVGTTPDYISWIRRVAPGQVLFLTDNAIREAATDERPGDDEEVTGDLSDFDKTRLALLNHLERYQLRIEGIACFDCESLELAARLAELLCQPFPSVEAVRICRNKRLAKERWHAAGVPTASSADIGSAEELRLFFLKLRQPCVIKPLCGSGSELVFLCTTLDECDRAFEQLGKGVAGRLGSRMYEPVTSHPIQALAEEYLEGPEYSCDFLVEGERVAILRFTRKLPLSGGPLGSTRAYVPVEYFDDDVPSLDEVRLAMAAGACALGLDKTICMADFIFRRGEIMLLEMTPRPGGDCLPHLALAGAGFDMLSFAVNFARLPAINGVRTPYAQSCVGLRLFAPQNGVIVEFDLGALVADRRVRQTHLFRQKGHLVNMPPLDYDSWLLGHVIFEPEPGVAIASQCDELANKLVVGMNAI